MNGFTLRGENDSVLGWECLQDRLDFNHGDFMEGA